MLLLGHGGGQSKDSERFVGLSRQYAEQTGLAVGCMDAADHGERAPAGAEPGVPREWHSSTVDRMVADWQTVTDHMCGIGPAVAYVGFSMGVIFGLATVSAVPSVKAAVFVAGGLPTGGWTDDPTLGAALLEAAARLESPHVLMLNKSADEFFAIEGVCELFEAIPAPKELRFSHGTHDDWPPELIEESVEFIRTHAF